MTPNAPGARAAESIYLDHAAATPLLPEVAAAMEAVRETGFANPSSPHAAGRRAKRLLEDARERIVALVGGDLGPGARLLFTSGATEANRTAILGMAAGPRGLVLTSARDHAAVVVAAAAAGARGWRVRSVPLSPTGTLAPAALPAVAADGPDGIAPGDAILCVTLVCGQTGVREALDAVATWAAVGPARRVHVDATQAFLADSPALPFGVPPGVAATIALAPHKFGGPRGIGGLLVRSGVDLVPLVPGVQEAGLRGGTEPVALAVGFARAVELAVAERVKLARHLAVLRDRLETRLVAAAREAGHTARVVAGSMRAPHIATVTFADLDRQAFVMAADLEGVCCATGTACASGSSTPAPALVAMGLPSGDVAGSVRFSLGRSTSARDVDAAVERLVRVLVRMTPVVRG